jgi:hypothetical protein
MPGWEDRGEFALTFGNGPKVVRRINGRDQVVHLGSRHASAEEKELAEMDELLTGVTSADLGGRRSGFMRHHLGTAGAGVVEGDPYPKRTNNYDGPNDRADPSSSRDGHHLGEDPSADINMQEYGERPREEGDFVDDPPNERARNTDPFTSPTSIQSRDFYDNLDQRRDREKGQGTPLFGSVADEIDHLFDE